MKETPKNSREVVEKFFILLCAGQEKEAEKVLKFADDNFPPDFNVKFNLGNLYLQRGSIDLAVFFLNQAKSIKNVPAVYDVLATAYVKYGDINSAEKTLDEGISIFSKDKEKDSQIIFSLFLKRGIIRLIKGDIKRAEDDIKQALSIYESPYALVILAEIKGKKNELNSAKELVYKASSLSDSIDIQIYSAAFLHSYGYFEEATQYYINVAEKSAGIEKYISFFMLGTIYRDIGRYMDSRDFFKMAYEYQQLATVPPPFSEAKRMELVKKNILNQGT
jgi:tetratricopeptide (TPR) repeat protein